MTKNPVSINEVHPLVDCFSLMNEKKITNSWSIKKISNDMEYTIVQFALFKHLLHMINIIFRRLYGQRDALTQSFFL